MSISSVSSSNSVLAAYQAQAAAAAKTARVSAPAPQQDTVQLSKAALSGSSSADNDGA